MNDFYWPIVRRELRRRLRLRLAGRPARAVRLLACLLMLSVLSSCSASRGGGGEARIRLVSWNLQTFFDARRDGCEYKDFVSDRHWGEQAYRDRLERLCDCLARLDADVLVLEELESEAVLRDLGNFLCAKSLRGRRYRWAAFAKEEGAALGVAVLSRYPLDGLSCHGIDLRSSFLQGRPGLRPLLRLRVSRKGRSCFLLVNHWKSMSGGREASEIWREMQEGILGDCIDGLGRQPAVACGDFNRDIGDFAPEAGGKVALRRPGEGGAVAVSSPWFLPDGTLAEPGSYHYRDEWSRIDGFLYSGGMGLEDFRAETEGPWCYEDTKVPKKYQVWSGRGYSDHLPISCTLIF